ncbi:hypothetical protein NQ314_009305 [Rhamnusium bicolor]|uniref:PiggyBac transposable element-derived protein domain-containing protein n=1 Tax=Rhamnusium bicolor TaxID=1586634 RepID=A0AAV8Y2J2_9CUCU|nr:hypothetical protein NQ314_009305 [Rhamnusium bicolor]
MSRLPTRALKTPLEIWKYFITDEILFSIMDSTNKFINSVKEKFSHDRDARPTDILEMQAFIGLLYYAGILKANHLNADDLWKTDGSGVEIFRLTMALFVDNCKNGYSLSKYVTVDERLEAYRGRCSFRQYIPPKPSRYGIKIFALADIKLMHVSNMEVYVGQQPERPLRVSNSPDIVVKRLCQHIYGSGRNLTIDNWFTSIDLVDALHKEKNYCHWYHKEK